MAKKSGSKGNPNFDLDFTKFLGQFQMPGSDANPFLESQRRNIEAIATASRLVLEGSQAIMRRQAEIVQQAMEQTAEAARQLAAASSQEGASQQVERMREVFERSLTNLRELAEMLAKSNTDAFNVVNNRFVEGMDELKRMIERRGGQG